MLPPIKGYIENTLLDWEGKLSAVVFLPGCNFRCGYCHAPHLIDPPPDEETIPLEAVLLGLRRQKGWIDGVVISGGEPTLHPGLPDLIRAFRDEGIGVKLDTNGTRPEILDRLIAQRLVDYVAMDIKAPLDERYSEVAGVPVALADIRSSTNLLMRGDVTYEFRTTVCPSSLGPDEVESIAKAIEGARRYYLQSFRPLHCLNRDLESVTPYHQDAMRDLCRIAAKHVQRCMVRGDQGSECVTEARSINLPGNSSQARIP